MKINIFGIIFGLLMILCISGQTEAQGISEAIELIKKLYEYGMKVYGAVGPYVNPDKTGPNIVNILNKVNEISNQIDTMERNLDIKLNSLLNTLLADIRLETTLNPMRTKIRHSFSRIDVYFADAIQYKIGGLFNNHTLKEFAHKVLWDGGSVPDLLADLHEVLIPGGLDNIGYLSVLLERTMVNINVDCDKEVSTQQHLYYIYIQTFISEVKGLIIRIQALMIQRYFDASSASYSAEIRKVKTAFQNHVREYNSLFTRRIPDFPTHLRRCDASHPVLGTNYIELQKFVRIQLLDKMFVGKNARRDNCPARNYLDQLGADNKTTIGKCEKLANIMELCLAEPGSQHKYAWMRGRDGTQYGPRTTCNKTETINAGVAITSLRHSLKRPVCACETTLNGDPNDGISIWRVSVTPQYSDFPNDKVVTGVKFVTKDNALHLQIHQAAFPQSGMAHDSGEWKDLDTGFHDAGFQHTKAPMHYQKLDHNYKTFYLDDVKAPDGYVITGVKLDPVDSSAFMLSIFVCSFNFNFGEVDPFECKWVNGNSNPMNPSDYRANRTAIDVSKDDIPTRTSQFQYDLKSHKKVSFTHSDLHKDAGQTTIPFIDSQPVAATPPFPLSGIGFTIRSKEGYAGYIAPRIFTFNFANYMNFPTINLNPEPITTTPKQVKWVFQDSEGNPYKYHENREYHVTIV